MSTRCRNDLVGTSSRITSSLNGWRDATAGVQEVWNDATAQSFYGEHFRDTEQTLTRMIASLHEAAELVRTMERAVADQDEA